MEVILLLIVFVIIVSFFFGIGLILRKRSRRLKVAVTTCIAVVVFLCLAFVGSGIGIGVYDFYQFEVGTCQEQSTSCVNQNEQKEAFRALVPRLTLWMTIPKPFRPACNTISPEFCLLEGSYDMAPYNYLAGAFGAVIVIFLIGQGMRQKDKEEAKLDISTST